METYCNQCKKNMSITNFDMKNKKDYYTRCKPCRAIHNHKNKDSYTSTKKKFSDYDGLTSLGKKKVDCWSDKNDKKPCDVAMCSHTKFWFACDKCPHEFESALSKVTRSRWCPFCAIPCQKLCDEKVCDYCFKNSFASYDGLTHKGNNKVGCWSEKNILQPRHVAKNSNKKFWFQCDACPHEFESTLGSVVTSNTWCPFCAIPCQKLCDEKVCDYCFKNSFASYDGLTHKGNNKVGCWSEKNILQPRHVAKNSNKKFWFQCDACPHEFESNLGNVVNGRWCPYCAIPCKLSCNDKGCQHCFNKSFARYDRLTSKGKKKVDCWSEKNPMKPRDVSICNGNKFWFNCDICSYEFQSALNNIKGGSWCPHCINKTELKLYNWLLQHTDVIKEVKREYAPKWCSTEYTHIVKNKFKEGRYPYRYDFLVTFKNKKQLIIELDGPQHYEQVSDWKAPLEQQIRDKYKEFKAKKNKISLIRCIQEDVWMDRNDWQIRLENLLQQYH
jgi:hypothetical protein